MTERDISDILTTLDATRELENILEPQLLNDLESVSNILERKFGPYESIRQIIEDGNRSVEERVELLMENHNEI